MKTIHKFLQQKINLKPAKKIKSCTLSKKNKKKNGMFTSYINQIEDAGDCGIYHYVK